MPITITLSDAQAQRLLAHLIAQCPETPASDSTSATLATILQEIQTMSQTQTQAAADVAQLGTDIQTLTTGLADLKGQIASLQQAAQQAAGTVPADLQAKIDELHTLAQTVAPAVQPTPPADGGQDTTGGGQTTPPSPGTGADTTGGGQATIPGGATDTGGAPQGPPLTPEPQA